MELKFNSVEELQTFVKEYLKTKRKAGDKDENEVGTQQLGGTQTQVPALQQAPPGVQFQLGGQGGAAVGQFSPPGTQFNPTGAQPQGFNPQGGGMVLSPEAQSLVARILPRIDGCISSGQPVEQVLGWFRSEAVKYGVDATNANLEQIKTICLPKIPLHGLEAIAKLMAA